MVIQPLEFNDDTEKQLLYNVLFDLKNDVKNLKDLVFNFLQKKSGENELSDSNRDLINKIFSSEEQAATPQTIITHSPEISNAIPLPVKALSHTIPSGPPIQEFIEANESLKLADKEKELIILALKKHQNKRKYAAKDLGISERTLYRKIKEYDIN
jgi:transcriptional regulator of acetoin/glycerol metabolism